MDNRTIIEDLKDRTEKFGEEFAKEFLKRVQRRTPYASGTLYKGFRTDTDKNGVYLYNPVTYYEYVEYGTPKMAPRRMVTRTMLEAEQIARQVTRQLNRGS